MQPLLFFVHVPKTAGTTVNGYLKAAMPNGRAHCESIMRNDAELRTAANSMDWLSGHVNFSAARARLSVVTDRPVRFFTTMREPTRQVMSHLNWLIEIYHRGPSFYDSHPLEIKALSSRIRETDLTVPQGVIDCLLLGRRLLLNFQSRTILGHRFQWNGGHIRQRLSQYEMIAKESGLKSLVRKMTGENVADVVVENASSYHFNKDIFASDALRKFLRANNTLDDILYDLIDPAPMMLSARE